MSVRIAGRQLANEIDLRFGDRTHGDHHRPMEAPGRHAAQIRNEHAVHGVALDVAQGDTGLDQRVLEGQAAAE